MTAIPSMPDSARLTEYTPAASTGPFDVGFDLYGTGADSEQWIEVWLDGIQLTVSTDWILTSPSGSLATLARPIRDAQVTLIVAATGVLDIVGCERPRRETQLVEGHGFTAHDFNLAYTDLKVIAREMWDKFRRVPSVPGGEEILRLPPFATRANKLFGFDSGGNPTMLPPASATTSSFTPSLDIGLIGTQLAYETFGDPSSTPAKTPTLLQIAEGTVAEPITAINPTVTISRIQHMDAPHGIGMDGDGSEDAALNVVVQSNGGTLQAVAIRGAVSTFADGGAQHDNVAVYGTALMSGDINQNRIAYGGYFLGVGTTVGNGANSIGAGLFNNTGVDDHWAIGGGGWSLFLGLDLVAQGTNNLIGGGVQLRRDPSNTTTFDVGFGAREGSVKTAFLQDDSSSITVLLASALGTHTNGIDLSASTFSGNSFKSPGFAVTGAGVPAFSSATAIPAGGTAGTGVKVSSTANFGVFFGSGAPTLAAAKGSLYLRSDGSTTNDRMYVNTNGSTTWTAVTTAA